RTVELSDGLIKVNGRPVLFKGVNRHEWHPVKVTCAGTVLTGMITVARPGAAAGRPEEPIRLPAQSPSPIAPVPAGGGGTAHFATVATSASGPDAVQAATGLALAGAAAVAVGLRARRSRAPR
ncbi:glycoside hydrolase family 2 TIM barrel-domain containing protein, partial [Streptomyces flaveolus]